MTEVLKRSFIACFLSWERTGFMPPLWYSWPKRFLRIYNKKKRACFMYILFKTRRWKHVFILNLFPYNVLYLLFLFPYWKLGLDKLYLPKFQTISKAMLFFTQQWETTDFICPSFKLLIKQCYFFTQQWETTNTYLES